jgi:hypothetical protein
MAKGTFKKLANRLVAAKTHINALHAQLANNGITPPAAPPSISGQDAIVVGLLGADTPIITQIAISQDPSLPENLRRRAAKAEDELEDLKMKYDAQGGRLKYIEKKYGDASEAEKDYTKWANVMGDLWLEKIDGSTESGDVENSKSGNGDLETQAADLKKYVDGLEEEIDTMVDNLAGVVDPKEALQTFLGRLLGRRAGGQLDLTPTESNDTDATISIDPAGGATTAVTTPIVPAEPSKLPETSNKRKYAPDTETDKSNDDDSASTKRVKVSLPNQGPRFKLQNLYYNAGKGTYASQEPIYLDMAEHGNLKSLIKYSDVTTKQTLTGKYGKVMRNVQAQYPDMYRKITEHSEFSGWAKFAPFMNEGLLCRVFVYDEEDADQAMRAIDDVE